MGRAILISLALHLAALAGAVWGSERGARVRPQLIAYTVNLVPVPGGQSGLGSGSYSDGKRRAATPKTDAVRQRSRTGMKVDEAPSTEATAPKGTKKPARKRGETPGSEGSEPGRAIEGDKGPGGGGGGMRLEGEPFPYPEYLQDLQRRIEAHWQLPLIIGNTGTLKATVFFRVLRNGEITDFKVEKRSGVLSFDRAALEAVVGSSLPSLPDGFQGGQLGVHFDFEY